MMLLSGAGEGVSCDLDMMQYSGAGVVVVRCDFDAVL